MITYIIAWEDAHGDTHETNRDNMNDVATFVNALATTPGCDLIGIQTR